MNQKRKKRRLARKRFLLFCASALLLAGLLLSIFFAGFWANIHMPTILGFFEKKYVCRIGVEESSLSSRKRFVYTKDRIVRDGQYYVNFSYIAEVCSFSVSGDAEQLRYLLRNETDDRLTVNIGSAEVNVSGQSIMMPAPAFAMEDGTLYLPTSFVDAYFDGIRIEVEDNEESRLITVSLDIDGEYSLILHRGTGIDPISPDAVPDQISSPTDPGTVGTGTTE